MKSEEQLAQNWFIFNVFNSSGFTDFVLVLFPFGFVSIKMQTYTNRDRRGYFSMNFGI